MRFTSLAVAILLVSGALVVALLPEALHRFESSGDALIFAGSLATFVVGSGLLARRDSYAFAWLMAFIGGFGLACLGLVVMVEARVSLELWGFAAGSAVLCVAAGTYIARTQFRSGAVPDVLAEQAGRRAVFEIDDVQLTATCPFETPANFIASVDVCLQNCLDSARTVTVELDDQPLFGPGGGIHWRRPEPVQLGPSEVKLVRIPFCSAKPGSSTQLAYLRVRASGEPGKRVRHRRAPYAAHPLKRWQIAAIVVLASPFFWILVWGRGGVKVDLRFTNAQPLRRPDELPEPSVQLVWSPFEPGHAPELATPTNRS